MQQMTEQEFEMSVVTYGSDMAGWPDTLQQIASAFIATTEGRRAYENARKLDERMMQMQAELQGEHSDAFLAQLKAIPAGFEQQHSVAFTGVGGKWTIGSLIDRAFEPARLWSPAGLVSQGAFAAGLLFAGLMVGANAAGSESFEDYDISASLFENSEQEYSIDG